MKKLSDEDYSFMLTVLLDWTKEAAKGTAIEYQGRMSEIPEEAPIFNLVEGENHAPPPDKEFLDQWAKNPKDRKAIRERLRRVREGTQVKWNKDRRTVLSHIVDFVNDHRAFPSTGELAEQFGYETGSGIYVEASETRDLVWDTFEKVKSAYD